MKHIGHGVIQLAQKGKKRKGGTFLLSVSWEKTQKKILPPSKKEKNQHTTTKVSPFFIKNTSGGLFHRFPISSLDGRIIGIQPQFQAEKRRQELHVPTERLEPTEVTRALADRLCRSLEGRGKNTFDQKPTNDEWSCWKTWATFCKEGKEVVWKLHEFFRVDIRLISGKFFFKKKHPPEMCKSFFGCEKEKNLQGAHISEMALQDQLHPSWSQREQLFTKSVVQSMLHK